jgi:hypothetical protein
MIFAILRSLLFNLMFIFFSVNDICFFTINVDNKTSTRWKKNNHVETSISSINLLRSKLLISLRRCSLRLFKKSSFKVVRIFVKTSRRFMNDDITSIRAENLYVFQTINILQDQVINTSRMWLLCDRFESIFNSKSSFNLRRSSRRSSQTSFEKKNDRFLNKINNVIRLYDLNNRRIIYFKIKREFNKNTNLDIFSFYTYTSSFDTHISLSLIHILFFKNS